MRYRQAPRARGVFYPDDEGHFFFPLVHIFRDDELDELARHVYAAAIGADVDLLDDDEWRPTLDILRNHGR